MKIEEQKKQKKEQMKIEEQKKEQMKIEEQKKIKEENDAEEQQSQRLAKKLLRLKKQLAY